MVSRDVQRIRNLRATGMRQRATDAAIDSAVNEKLRKAKEHKFRSVTKDLNAERREVAKRFHLDQLVAYGNQTGRVKAIDPKTGDIKVKLGLRTIKVSPTAIEPV